MAHVASALLRVVSFLYQVVVSLFLGLALLPALWLVLAAWRTGSLLLLALSLGLGYFVSGLTFLLLIVVLKRLLLFRAREGDYPFLSAYTFRWATIGTLVGLAKVFILNSLLGSPVLNLFYRLMGARIGRNVVINTCNMFDFDLIEIGDDTMLGGDAVVIGHVGEGGRLHLRPVRIGRRCTVGQSAVVFPGAVMDASQ